MPNNETTIPRIGEGIYLTQDVAQILRLPYSRVRYWMNEIWDNQFGEGRLYTFGDDRNKAVNFYTLIEFYTFSQLRSQGVTVKRIKDAHSCIAKDLNTDYPFALKIATDGKSIWYEWLNELIRADGKQQLDLKKILQPFLHKVEFGSDDLAERYFPLDKSKNVVIDPKRQFGQPTLFGRNLRAEVLYKLIEGGETADSICDLYNLHESQINDVVKFFKTAA